LIGAKPYEFRSWVPPRSMIGRRIAIHAGARKVNRAEVAELLLLLAQYSDRLCLHRDIAEPALEKIQLSSGSVPLSHVLCTAILGEPKRADACAREFGHDFGVNDSARVGTFNWGWPLTKIEPLQPPVPARGAQGFWDWGGHRT
jgi:hypothetical protein